MAEPFIVMMDVQVTTVYLLLSYMKHFVNYGLLHTLWGGLRYFITKDK